VAPVRWRLTPRDTAIIDLLNEAAQALVEGARLLQETFQAPVEAREQAGLAVREAEHRSDEITHATLRRLNSTFVTPFDRDDIYALSSALDDCMDHMEAAADALTLTRPVTLPAGVSVQLSVLSRQAACTAAAFPRLHTMEGLEHYWVEINRLENEADQVYREMLAALFDGRTPALELLKIKEVIDALESAADAFETVSHHVETIAVKES
jgi:predicted phosphate transport protein (TIGR00153 family)